jgi:aldehyde dehydrogenase (NAD+)
MNSGQQCISPDMVLCHRSVVDRFCEECAGWLREFYENKDPKESAHFGRIVGDSQLARIRGMLDTHGGRVVCGGEVDAATRYVAPTVVRVGIDSPALDDETFGPILWVTPVDDMDEAVRYMRDKPKPLSLYVFSRDEKATQRILQNTSSGGVTVNGCLFHVGHPELPFGGVGDSGMGSYHGKGTFDAFTHAKPCMVKQTDLPAALSDPYILYAPWSDHKVAIIKRLYRMA